MNWTQIKRNSQQFSREVKLTLAQHTSANLARLKAAREQITARKLARSVYQEKAQAVVDRLRASAKALLKTSKV